MDRRDPLVGQMTPDDNRVDRLRAALGSPDAQHRIAALVEIRDGGVALLQDLTQIVTGSESNLVARVWAMMGIGQFGPAAAPVVREAVLHCLHDASPTIRRAALRLLGQVQDETLLHEIAGLLHDHAQDPSAWFDDDCTVAQTAEAALRTIAGLDARELLAQHRRVGK